MSISLSRHGLLLPLAWMMFLAGSAAAATPAHLVKDIRVDASHSFYTLGGLVLGRTLYFTVDDGTSGRLVWKSDGSPHGTHLLEDVRGGAAPLNSDLLATAGGRVYFFDANGLWVTGAPDGTHPIRGVMPLPGSGFAELGGRVYFAGFDAGAPWPPHYGVWSTDGTDTGTARVADFVDSSPYNLTAIDGALWFFTRMPADRTGVLRYGFYRLDPGSPAMLLREFAGDLRYAGYDPFYVGPAGLTDVAGWAYFFASDGIAGAEPWRSDGTPEGTVRLRDIAPGPASSYFNGSGVALNNRFVFLADDAPDLVGLWSSDRISGATELLREFPAKSGTSHTAGPVTLGYRALFVILGELPGNGDTLWTTDGTREGTLPVHTFGGLGLPIVPSPEGGRAFFRASDSGALAIWSSDGTAAGTVPMGEPFSDSARIAGISPDLVFLADSDGRSEDTLTTLDTRASSEPQKVFSFRFPGSTPRGFTALGSRVIFGALEDRASYFSLWSSDGTDPGTVRLLPGVAPETLRAFGNRGYLFGSDERGPAVFVTDGTVAGTLRLATLASFGSDFVALGGAVYFIGNGDLWKTDGSPSGTVQITSGLQAQRPLVSDGARLYFKHLFSVPWMSVSDGTATGTHPVFVDAPGASSDFEWVPWRGGIIQAGFTNPAGAELWFSDGTSAGTRIVADLLPGPESSGPHSFVASERGVFFAMTSPASLWITDGTPGGTRQLREGAASELVLSGGTLFFVASDAEHGQELWKSDGTSDGTMLVADIAPGPDSGMPRGLRDVGGTVLFAANDGVHGFELWRSDGTESGTFLLQDVNPGFRSSNPAGFTRAADQVFFTADDGLSGYEPWVMPTASLDGTLPPRRPQPRVVQPR